MSVAPYVRAKLFRDDADLRVIGSTYGCYLPHGGEVSVVSSKVKPIVIII